jgi:hypothetical protein
MRVFATGQEPLRVGVIVIRQDAHHSASVSPGQAAGQIDIAWTGLPGRVSRTYPERTALAETPAGHFPTEQAGPLYLRS